MLVLQSKRAASEMETSLNGSNKLLFTPLPKKPQRDRSRVARQHPEGQTQAIERSPYSQTSSSDARDISPTTAAEALKSAVGDEQIVSTAAINFLNALSIHDVRCADWTLERKQFKFKSDSVKFEARTDGHLQVHGHERSAAILEVKSRVRQHEPGCRLEMQESAQMALWIYQEPNSHWPPRSEGDKLVLVSPPASLAWRIFRLGPFSRVLISQDRHEIYVMLAEYTLNYMGYLRQQVIFKDAELLRMTSYGPFFTTEDRHMSSLGGHSTNNTPIRRHIPA